MEAKFLQDFLFKDEVVKFTSSKPMKFSGNKGRFIIYLTNQRLIAHRRKGLLRRKDDVTAEKLDNIHTLRHVKRHRLEIVNSEGAFVLRGKKADVDGLWKTAKTCRLASQKPDEVQDISYSEKGIFRKMGSLFIQTSKGRLLFEGEADDVRALWQEFKKSSEQREIGF